MSEKNKMNLQEEMDLIKGVDEQRITLVDDQDTEFEFIILDEFECEGNIYYALASCDEKVEKGSSTGDSEGDEITVVRVKENAGVRYFFAISDADELYKVAKIVEQKFGHLTEV